MYLSYISSLTSPLIRWGLLWRMFLDTCPYQAKLREASLVQCIFIIPTRQIRRWHSLS